MRLFGSFENLTARLSPLFFPCAASSSNNTRVWDQVEDPQTPLG